MLAFLVNLKKRLWLFNYSENVYRVIIHPTSDFLAFGFKTEALTPELLLSQHYFPQRGFRWVREDLKVLREGEWSQGR